jgi:acyl carrier protein
VSTDIERFTSEAVQPLSATERVVATLWCEALRITELPRAPDNFFALGGDSMTMTMLEFRIKEELSVDLPPGAILNAPSLRELSALIDETRGGR